MMRIIYFDLDSVRKDHLGVYGYERKTSPVIDALAQDAAVFEQCYVSDSPCLPSRAAMFTARPGISNGVVSHEFPGCVYRFPGKEGMPGYYPEYTMPMRLLQQHDYHTVTFSVFAQRHMAWWFNAGFSEVVNPTRPNIHEHADSVNPRVVKWIRNHIHDHDNLFLHINYWDAHTPYHPDASLIERVASGPLPDFPDEETIHDHYANFYGPKSARDIMIRNEHNGYKSPNPLMPDEIANRSDFKHMCDSYDASIAVADRAVGEVLDALKDAGVYDDCVIIVSADHGEAIGQMGMYFEHGVAVDGVTNVPLIVRVPDKTQGGIRSDAMIYQYDVMATLMDLLDIPLPERWDAESFMPVLNRTEKSFTGRPYVVYGCGIFALQRAIRTPGHALVYTFHPGCSPLEDVYLFDMQRDPHQQHNIFASEPEAVAQLEALYAAWWRGWCVGPEAVIDPFVAQTPVFEYFPVDAMRRRLKHLGREDQLNDLDERLAQHRRFKPQSPQFGSNF